MAKRLPKTLYHYCSLQTFKSIIENKSIWLSDIRKSNDSKELEWIKEKSEYYLLKTWVDYLDSMDSEQRFKKVSSNDFKRVDELKELISNFSDIKTWAFCLSEKKDDLSQWRGYADDGAGISIGFNGKFLKALQVINGLDDGNQDLFFTNVNYTDSQAKDFYYRYLEMDDINSESSTEEVIEKLSNCVYSSMANAPFFKNPSFKDEREWRLTYSMKYTELLNGKTPDVFPLNENGKKMFETDFGYITKSNELVSHIEIKFGKIEGIISSITLGPKSKLSALEMKEYLISQGVLENALDNSVEVHISSSTYR